MEGIFIIFDISNLKYFSEDLNNMARYNKNSQSGIVGKLGPLVLTPDSVRTRPRKRTGCEWTDKQKAQRIRMKSVAEFYQKAKYPIVEYVWRKTMPSLRVAYTEFVKNNMDAFDRSGRLADPLMLKMTVGELKLPYKMGTELSGLNKNIIHVNWENNLPEGWSGGQDSLMGILFNGDSFSLPLDFKARRNNNHAVISLPLEYSEGYYLYLFFMSHDKKKISGSFSLKL